MLNIKKELLSRIPSKSEFVTDTYINKIIETGMWSEHGANLECFLNYIEDEIPEFSDVANFDSFMETKEFKEKFKIWLNNRYDYVIRNLLEEIKKFPLEAARVINVTDDIKNKILNSNPEKIDFGFFWSIGNAEIYFPDEKNKIRITADINIEDINWHETLVSRFDYDNGDFEMEIQTVKGVALNIKKIEFTNQDIILNFNDVKDFLNKKNKKENNMLKKIKA